MAGSLVKSNAVAVARDQEIWIVPETTRGILAFPSGLDDTQNIVAAGPGSMTQNPSFSDSQEVANTRDITAQFQDQMPAGSWSFPVYPRPGGAAGDKPAGAPLYKALLGKETINAGGSVVYGQTIVKPSVSIWMRMGHTIMFSRGCVVTGARLNATNKGGVQLEFSGQLMQMGWCGNMTIDNAAGYAQGAVAIKLDDARRICVGARFQYKSPDELVSDDNAGAGYTVLTVDYTTNIITIAAPGVAPVGGWVDNGYIYGFLPATPSPLVGAPIESRKTSIQINNVATSIQSLDWNYNDPVQFTEEISVSGYPSDWMEQARTVNGNISLYFRRDDARLFREGYAGFSAPIALTMGTDVGKRLKVTMGQCQIQVPEINVSDPAVNLRLGYAAKGLAGEDSCSFTFF